MNVQRLFYLLLLLSSCEQKASHLQIRQRSPKIIANSVVKSDVLISVNGLKATYKDAPDPKLLINLDSLVQTSDGETSEALGEIVVEVYTINPVYFFKAVYTYQLTHLADALATGISADLSVPQVAQRQAQLAEFKKRARSVYQYLTKGEATNAESIVNKVDPTLFD